jgi:hypothetical protein
MIILEHERLALLTPQKGMIFANEHGQKFKVTQSTNKALFAEPYEGKGKATFFAYTGDIPSQNNSIKE